MGASRKRSPAPLAAFLSLPIAGVVVASAGITSSLTLPSHRSVMAIEERAAELRRTIAALETAVRERAGDDHLARYADELPLRLGTGQLLALLEDAARRSSITSITFTMAPQDDAGPPASELPAESPTPHVVASSVMLTAPYQNLTRFLGILETTRPRVGIQRLEVEAAGADVRARVELHAYYHPGRPSRPEEGGGR